MLNDLIGKTIVPKDVTHEIDKDFLKSGELQKGYMIVMDKQHVCLSAFDRFHNNIPENSIVGFFVAISDESIKKDGGNYVNYSRQVLDILLSLNDYDDIGYSYLIGTVSESGVSSWNNGGDYFRMWAFTQSVLKDLRAFGSGNLYSAGLLR